ncbi:MAG: DUF4352 domain-containing protein [Lachnospiraceae bacterium]|jgi:hypothetical protein|nr:DUF4352 domain-containing protein [Lachnospiraceae bacterium]
MKRRIMAVVMYLALSLLCLAGMAGCQGGSGTVADKVWKEARKEDSLEKYITEHTNEIDGEALWQEAESEDNPMADRFKATALLCAMEYSDPQYGIREAWKKGVFYADYPKTGELAGEFLKKVSEGEAFWTALEEAFYPYDCFWPLLAAAEELDGATLQKLLEEVPQDSKYGSGLRESIDRWVKANPGRFSEVGEALVSCGYYDDWVSSQWKETYLYQSTDPYKIRTDTLTDALAYISCVRDDIMPLAEGKYYSEESEILGESFYKTELTVTVAESLDLKPAGSDLPEFIETEGKKVVALYRNPQSEEFEGSPTPLRVLGDFMLQLPKEEYPSCAEEADYYLVLTSDMEYGGFYQTMGGGESGIQEVYSFTSVDLYEAGTGRFLRHLGQLTETAPDTVMADYGEQSLRYPELTAADVLTYLYRHINEPDAFRGLVDQTEGREEFAAGETVIFGSWEITYHSGEIVKEFDETLFHFEAEDGYQYVRCYLTITNIGPKEETFLPLGSAYFGGRELSVQLVDMRRETGYDSVDLVTSFECMNGSYLEPAETKEGVLIFKLPQASARNPEELCLVFYLPGRVVYYPLTEGQAQEQ